MIKSTTCIHAACDICGAAPENDYDGTSHFEAGQESDALAEAESQDWWTNRETSSVLCDKRDDAHLARAREIHDRLKAADDENLTSFLTYWPELDEQGRSERELRDAWFESLPTLDVEPGAAAHEHSFPIQPPHGSLAAPGDCECGATYTGPPVTLTASGGCEPCQGTGLNIGQPGDCPVCGGTGSCRATDPVDPEFESEEPCEPCDGSGSAAPAVRVFRVGDLVEITGRDGAEVTASSGAALNGKTGVVEEIDDNPEYPIGLAVEGFVGLVWCSSTELRHAGTAAAGSEARS